MLLIFNLPTYDFFTKNPNLEKKRFFFIYFFFGGGRGVGGGWRGLRVGLREGEGGGGEG